MLRSVCVRYQIFRSISNNRLFVLCQEGKFYEITPAHVRHLGPWQAQHRGDAYKLKPEYRLALVRDGYVLVKCEATAFKPEA